MVRIPGAHEYEFRVSGVMIEGGNDAGTGVQYPWEPTPRRHHCQTLTMRPFYIDKYPVTNAQFKEFLSQTATVRRTITISSATGATEIIPRVGPTSR